MYVKGYIFYQKLYIKGKELNFGAGPPRNKISWATPPPFLPFPDAAG